MSRASGTGATMPRARFARSLSADALSAGWCSATRLSVGTGSLHAHRASLPTPNWATTSRPRSCGSFVRPRPRPSATRAICPTRPRRVRTTAPAWLVCRDPTGASRICHAARRGCSAAWMDYRRSGDDPDRSLVQWCHLRIVSQTREHHGSLCELGVREQMCVHAGDHRARVPRRNPGSQPVRRGADSGDHATPLTDLRSCACSVHDRRHDAPNLVRDEGNQAPVGDLNARDDA